MRCAPSETVLHLHSASRMAAQSEVVYVVDDDASVRRALDSLIRSAGFGVETFASAQEFLASKPAASPACLVLDVSLPGLSGLDLQRELIQADFRIPIIFVTGHGDVPMSVQAMKAGAVEFFTKPFRDDDLLAAVRQSLDRDLASQRTKTDHRKELEAAARIQQGLMAVTAMQPSFANLAGKNVPCAEIGGDFFTAVVVDGRIVVAIADVSGKGIAAAVMASLLQGMIHEDLCSRVPLAEIAQRANEFFCLRDLGSKYATMAIASLCHDGTLEYMNCGHVWPLIARADGRAWPLDESNMPVGLLRDAAYVSSSARLAPGDRLVLVSDGVTDAESPSGEVFGEERLRGLVSNGMLPEQILVCVGQFCGCRPIGDDCTVVELLYQAAGERTESGGGRRA
jgi:FixJ family two-component response regulator